MARCRPFLFLFAVFSHPSFNCRLFAGATFGGLQRVLAGRHFGTNECFQNDHGHDTYYMYGYIPNN